MVNQKRDYILYGVICVADVTRNLIHDIIDTAVEASEFCPEWRNNFTAFRDWMLSQGYDETSEYGKQTLDRIDNNGDYSPDNCRLATIQEQNRNRCTRHILEYNGFSMSITEWNDKMGYPDGCIDNRIRKGWSVERAITTIPIRR